MADGRAGFQFAVLAATLLLAVATPVRAESDPRFTLRRVLVLVDQPNRLSPAERAARADLALANLRADPSLSDQAWLIDPLTANPPDLARANARISAALAALDAAPQTHVSASARADLDAVLADPRFHPADPLSLLPAWLVPVALALISVANFLWSIIRWPFDQIFALLQQAVGSRAFGPTMVALAALITVGVVLLYRRGLRAAIARQEEMAAPAGELPPTAADAIAAARARAADGEYRDACHYLLFSALLWVEERRGLRFDRAATNREHMRRVVAEAGPRSELVVALEPVVLRFDRLWYGQSAVSRDDYDGLATLVGHLQELAA
jgi:Domain of unknown function (DUF4129)